MFIDLYSFRVGCCVPGLPGVLVFGPASSAAVMHFTQLQEQLPPTPACGSVCLCQYGRGLKDNLFKGWRTEINHPDLRVTL